MAGVNWQTAPTAQVPMAAPEPLKTVSFGLAKVKVALL